MGKIKVAIAGLGNCASSLIQGLEYYKDTSDEAVIPGLMHNVLGDYRIRDIEIVAAFDVDDRKVGRDVSEAIFLGENCTKKFSDVPETGVKVMRGPIMDGIGKYLSSTIPSSNSDPVNVVEEIKNSGADMLVNYLPVGSEKAVRYYAEQALEAGVGYINCMPVFIASNESWAQRFREKGLPIIGDDIKSQVGATIVHRVLSRLFVDRGLKIDRTYQLNVGGNTDFLNMLERERLKSKKISKTQAVTSQVPYDMGTENVHVGPSDYVPWLKDNKVCFIRIEGRHFGDVPMYLDLRLSVEDSPNSAGVVIDAIRCMKIALENKVSGPLYGPSAYFMKSPPVQYTDPVAKQKVENFIEKPDNRK